MAETNKVHRMKRAIRNYITAILVLFCGVTLWSCSDNERVYEQINDLENGEWHRKDTLSYVFDIKDTTQYYYFLVSISNTIEYPYYNLYLNYELSDTLGNKVNEDLVELYLFDPQTGAPYGDTGLFGSTLSGTIDHLYPIGRLRFPKAGTYQLELSQNMRTLDPIKEINAVGLRINQYTEQ